MPHLGVCQCPVMGVGGLTLDPFPAERYRRNVESDLNAVDAEVDKVLARLSQGRQSAEKDVITMRQELPRHLEDARTT